MIQRTFLIAIFSVALPIGLRAADPKPLQILKTTGSVKWLAFTPDGKALLSASEITANGGTDGHELRLWDVATGKLLVGPVKTEHASASGAISPDGKSAVTGSFDATWQLWSLPDLKPGVKGLVVSGRAHRIAFSPDGKTFAVLRANYQKRLLDPIKANRVTYTAYTFDAISGKAVGEPQNWPRELWKDEAPTAVRISEPAGWSLGMSPEFGKDGRPVRPSAEEVIALVVPNDTENCGGPAACAISPDRKRAVSSGCNGQVLVWDYRTRKPIGDPLTKGEYLQIFGNALLFTPKSDRVAVVRMVEHSDHARPIITVYDVESCKPVGEPAKLGQTRKMLDAMAFAPDNETFAVATWVRGPADQPASNEIQLWKFATQSQSPK